MIHRTQWDSEIVHLVRSHTMGIIVGNGLSRLCGAPSWGDLFNSPDVRRVLEREAISSDIPYLELGYLLSKRAPVVWEGVLRRLYNWAQTSIGDESYAHRVLLKVLRPGRPTPPSIRIMTTNVDPLLERYEYRRDHIGYIHGTPNQTNDWIFTAEQYWDSWKIDHRISKIFSNFDAEGVLFLGYGHSHEDFDVIQMVIELRSRNFGRMFTLLTEQEAQQGDLRCRLDWQGIGVIPYYTPSDPTPLERELFLTKALLELAQDCEFDRVAETGTAYRQSQKWCSLQFTRRRNMRESALISLGLAGVNRHAALPGKVPSSDRRVAEAAEIRVEAGGPAYIVSDVARAVGIDSFLVSRLATDDQGDFVRRAISHTGVSGGRIYPDFVERAPAGEGVRDFRTWDSFVLEPSDELSHRVFIDRAMDLRALDLSDTTKHAVATMLRDGSKRVFYFDRHYRESIVHILRSTNYDFISDDVWTVYETDSDGGRYGPTSPGPFFDEKQAYRFEKGLAADQLQCINVVAASFRFARDCLAVHYGDLGRETYETLISNEDTEEIVGSFEPKLSEDEVIASLAASPGRLERFADAIRTGANRFLRSHPLRLVVVTLHRHGSFAVTVPRESNGTPLICYAPGVAVPGRRYTASAGDVFRGALVSALAHAQRQNLSAGQVMRENFINPLLDFCNRAASAKTRSPTVTDCLGPIKLEFDRWAAQVFGGERTGRSSGRPSQRRSKGLHQ